jgi:putative hydrolase of the HAD superfamily
MPELYSKLRENGYKMVLLSDQTNEWWPYLDNKFAISSIFDVVVISAKVGLYKPDPEIYKYALKVSNTFPDEALFIDDLEDNLIPAKALNIETILFKESEELITELKLKGIQI